MTASAAGQIRRRASSWLGVVVGSAFLASTGCVQVTGDFDTVTWSPTISRFAVADRHQLLDFGGNLVATQRTDAEKSLTLLLTTAWASPDEEWRRWPSDSLLNLRKELAGTDGLLLWNIPLAEVAAGAEFSLHRGTGLPGEPNDFDAAIVHNTTVANTETEQALGTAVEMKLIIEDADPKAHGFVTGSFELKRSRGDEQGEGLSVATGNVVLGFSLGIVAERRGKANLAIAAPIMRCADERGPSRSGACAEVPQMVVPEASDAIDGI